MEQPQSELTTDEFRRAHVGFPEVVDSTMMSAASCPQKFFLEYILKLSSTGRSPDLHAGGAFAHGLQHARLAFYRDKLPMDTAIARGWAEFTKYWGWYEPPIHSPKDYITTGGAFLDYFREYPMDRDEVQPFYKENKEPAVEFTFALPTEVIHPVSGNPIIYGGRCDMIGEFKNFLCTVDEKTTKALGPAWARSWQMRGQFLGYNFAAQRMGLDCSSTIIRGVALQKTQYTHMEVLEQYPQWQIERWWREMNRKLQHLVHMYEDTQKFIDHYKDTGERHLIRHAHEWWQFNFGDLCASYGGCEMLGLCTSENPTNWYADYDTRLWNPLDQDPSAKSPEKNTSGQTIPLEVFLA